MLNNRWNVVLLTAIAPMVWGTTYAVTSELLPPDRPLTASVLRALPAGLLLVAVTRKLPRGSWWWRSLVLGTLNIGAFFALLFLAAYRLPGGVAATVNAIQPLLAMGLSFLLLGEKLTKRMMLAGIAGVAGVSLLVLRAQARLDLIGVLAALGGALVMATGVVLSKRWRSPASPLATTGWQLVAGGLVLLPVMFLVEGTPPSDLSGRNLVGYGYLMIVGAVIAYPLWFRGISMMSPTSAAFLGLLSPVVATALGWLALGQSLTPLQAVGAAIVLAALASTQIVRRPRQDSPLLPADTATPVGR